MTKRALYFGCCDSGHFLHRPDGFKVYYASEIGIPWSPSLMDGDLLRNGKVKDFCDGSVFSTCGGRDQLWIAFYWWDRSGDSRPGSNSSFYVQGFKWEDRVAAFEYACEIFPQIIKRQKFPLILRDRK